MADQKPKSQDTALSDDELEKAVGGAKNRGAAGEAAVAHLLKKKRDDQEWLEETGALHR